MPRPPEAGPQHRPAGECFTRAWPRPCSALRPCHCAAPACIHHSPPFSAFSPGVHVPKSIYEGNFGCGYLKERRASGLVFCENTASVYRALFVSSRCFLRVSFLTETGRVAGNLCAPLRAWHALCCAHDVRGRVCLFVPVCRVRPCCD